MSEVDANHAPLNGAAAPLPALAAGTPLDRFLERLLPLLRVRGRAEEASAKRAGPRREAGSLQPAQGENPGAGRRADDALAHKVAILKDALRAYRERSGAAFAPGSEPAALGRVRKAIRALVDQQGHVEYRGGSDAEIAEDG